MIFSFGNDTPSYTIEVYIGNALVSQQRVRPLAFEMLIMQFTQICEQIANENQPMRCVCSGTKGIELPNGDWIEKPTRVEFYNNKWDGDIT